MRGDGADGGAFVGVVRFVRTGYDFDEGGEAHWVLDGGWIGSVVGVLWWTSG